MDCLHVLFHYTIPPVENRLHACSQRRLVQTPPLPSFPSDSTDSSAHNLVPLAGGAQSGLDAFLHAAQEARDKSRRPNLSAGATYYRNALNLPKPAGKYGNMNKFYGTGELVLVLIFRFIVCLYKCIALISVKHIMIFCLA